MRILSKFLGQADGARSAGLDLSDRGLCWVELRQDQGRDLVLERCIFEPLAPGCIVKGEILEFSEVEAALARLLGASTATSHTGAIPPMALAVPDVLASTHGVTFPAKLTDALVAEALQAGMAAKLQRKAEAICVDFVRSAVRATDRETDFIAAVVPKDAVEDRIALIEGAGLPWHAQVMALASQAAVLAASRAMERQAEQPKAVMALVRLELDALHLDILQQGKVLRSERFAVERSPEQAPELPEGLLEALEPAGGSAAMGRPAQLWWAGPADTAEAWAGELQERLGLPCALVDTFEGMVPGEALDGGGRLDPAQTLVACGLAWIALSNAGTARQTAHQPFFNFLAHREAAIAQRKNSFVRQLGAVTLAVLLGSAVLRVVLSEQLQTQQDAQKEIQKDMAELDAEIKRLAGVATEMQRLQSREGALIEFAQARQQTPLMWRELSVFLPDGLHLTSFRRDAQGAAVLSGQARSAAEVFDLMDRLTGGSQYFRRPELLDLSLLADPSVALVTAQAPTEAPNTTAAQAAPLERVIFTVRSPQP